MALLVLVVWCIIPRPLNNKKPLEKGLQRVFMNCDAPGGIRTPDRPLRRRMLYPAELLEQKLDMFHYRKSPGACQTFF